MRREETRRAREGCGPRCASCRRSAGAGRIADKGEVAAGNGGMTGCVAEGEPLVR